MIHENFIPLLLVLGLFTLLWDTRRDHPRVRLAVTLVPAVLLLPYLFWRVGSTLQVAGGQGWQAQAWIWAVGLIELLALLEVVFGVAWAWLGAGEAPAFHVFGGGAMVLTALAACAEQWRQGGTGATNNDLTLQYSINGTNFTTLGAAFDFSSPYDAGAAGALDGNAATNRVTGIGGAASLAFAAAGAKVFAQYHGGGAELAAIENAGVATLKLDLTEKGAPEALVAAALAVSAVPM